MSASSTVTGPLHKAELSEDGVIPTGRTLWEGAEAAYGLLRSTGAEGCLGQGRTGETSGPSPDLQSGNKMLAAEQLEVCSTKRRGEPLGIDSATPANNVDGMNLSRRETEEERS